MGFLTAFNMEKCKNTKIEGGFSLIEVSIALIVIGLIMMPLLYGYNQYVISRQISGTKSAYGSVNAALVKYVAKYGHYPFPSDPDLAQTDAGFSQVAVKPGAGWPVCTATSTKVCRTTANIYGGHAVLIGAVPFGAIGVPFKSTLDGYGSRLTYAVTEDLTDNLTYDETSGGIEVVDDAGVSIYTGLTQRSHFIIVSHGEDRRGAFTLAGLKPIACGTNLNSTDFENCNNDGKFRNNFDTLAQKNLLFAAAGVNHFDDMTVTNNISSSGLWATIPNSPSMSSSNIGNAYIGTCPTTPCIPKSHVDVEGHVRADAVKTSRICYGSSAGCLTPVAAGVNYIAGYSPPGYLSPDFIVGAPAAADLPDYANKNALYTWSGNTSGSGRQAHDGAGIRCVGDRGLLGTTGWTEYCNYTSNFKNTVNIGSCTGGTYASGVNAAGQLICVLP